MTMKSKDRDGEDDGELDDVMPLPHSDCCTVDLGLLFFAQVKN